MSDKYPIRYRIINNGRYYTRNEIEFMKELKFKTSKGDFALMDGTEQIDQTLKALLEEYTPVAKVSEMTEEKFTEVVDKLEWSDGYFMYYRYDKSIHDFAETWLARDSFLSLIHSLGWHLWENPKGKQHPDWREYASTKQYQQHSMDWIQAESTTLYNPILLKKI